MREKNGEGAYRGDMISSSLTGTPLNYTWRR